MLFLHLFTSSAGLGILTYHTHTHTGVHRRRPLFEPSLDGVCVCVNGCFPGPIQKVSIAAEGNLRGPNTYWRKLVERKG